MLTPANINYIDLNRVEVNILPCNLHFRRKALFGPSTGLLENKFFGQTNALGKNWSLWKSQVSREPGHLRKLCLLTKTKKT